MIRALKINPFKISMSQSALWLACIFSACATVNSPPTAPVPEPITEASVTPSSTPELERHLASSLQAAEELGPENPFFISSLYSLASYYEDHGKYEEAELLYQRALELKERTHGPDHPDVALILYHYADLLKKAKRSDEAKPLETRANDIYAKQASHPN